MAPVLIERLPRSPRTLFVVDGVGALATRELRVARAASTETPAMTTRVPLRRRDHGGAAW